MAFFGKKNQPKEPQFLASALNNAMPNYKVYYLSPKEKALWYTLVFALGGLVGQVFYGGLFKKDGDPTTATYVSNIAVFCVVGLIAVRFFVPMITETLKTRRERKLKKQFIDLLESLSVSLSSGSTVNDAFVNAAIDLQNQYGENEIIIVELLEITEDLRNGITLEASLENFAARSGNEDIQNFSNVMGNCYRLGGNFRDVVRKTRDIISEKVLISEEINTKLTSNKFQLNVMSVMPIIIILMMKRMSSDFASGFTSATGVLVITVAVGIFIGAYLWGRKIVDVR